MEDRRCEPPSRLVPCASSEKEAKTILHHPIVACRWRGLVDCNLGGASVGGPIRVLTGLRRHVGTDYRCRGVGGGLLSTNFALLMRRLRGTVDSQENKVYWVRLCMVIFFREVASRREREEVRLSLRLSVKVSTRFRPTSPPLDREVP
jgi:hypothetical protein